MLCFRKFPVAKKFMDKRGGGERGSIKIFRSNFFCLTEPKNFIKNPSVLCFRKLPEAKKFMDKRGGEREGVSRFSMVIVLSHRAKQFHRETLLCCVSENFRKRKSSWIREGGGGE